MNPFLDMATVDPYGNLSGSVDEQKYVVKLQLQRDALGKLFLAAVDDFKKADTHRKSVTFMQLEDRFGALEKIELELQDILPFDEPSFCKWVKTKDLFLEAKGSLIEEQKIAGQGAFTFKKAHLPQLNVKIFDISPQNWLQFWGYFEPIDSDTTIPVDAKYRYLMQSLEADSKAMSLMKPFSPNSYDMAIKSLQERFGREELIIEVHVRALLQLVLQNDKNDLATLFDNINTHVRALESFKLTTDKYAVILSPLIESALPVDVLKHWERQKGVVQLANSNPLDELMKFLENEVRGEERSQLASSFSQSSPVPTASTLINIGGKQNVPFKERNRPRMRVCVFCSRDHFVERCFKAQKMTLDERKETLLQSKACMRCCNVGHDLLVCRSQIICIICSGPHLTIICPSLKSGPAKEQAAANSHRGGPAKEHVTSTLITTGDSKRVYLQTLQVCALGKNKKIMVRLLLDSAADRSYIKEGVASKLNLTQCGSVRLSHNVFGGVVHKAEIHNIYNLTLSSDGTSGSHSEFEVEVVGINKICSNIPPISDMHLIKELNSVGIHLSDIGSDVTDIDILLGSNDLAKLITANMKQTKTGPLALQTRLGWVLMGSKRLPDEAETHAVGLLTMTSIWDLANIGITDPAEHKEKSVHDREMLEQVGRDVSMVNGRYQVKLPWKGMAPANNQRTALSRLENVTDRLRKQELYQDYDRVLQEWIDLGIIEVVERPEAELGRYYLPHRPVIKEGSTTTRIRPVFDASAKSPNCLSLNDCLESGPNMVSRIPDLLNRFRNGKIGVYSDISKAFLQISVEPSDRDYLRFLWWNEQDKIIELRHTRVVFGITSSPCHLAVVISKHLSSNETLYSETVKILQSSFYVDNVLTAVESLEDYEKFKREASSVMSTGKFELTQWTRNRITSDTGEQPMGTINALGLIWNLDRDTLGCRVPVIQAGTINTKRELLSVTQSIFDILGIWCPVLIPPKVVLQTTWKMNLGWEDNLPDDLKSQLLTWMRNLPLLSQCVIPRQLSLMAEINELHIFCDASGYAYATCIFLRTVTVCGTDVRLVQASNRIAPIERLSIPRLELLAATIASRLYKTVVNTLKVEKEYFWSDSQVVLNWIKLDRPWKRFVKNRVDEINKLTSRAAWRFVPGHLNPADLPSRGCDASQLLKSQWWLGPDWLKLPESEWPPEIDSACPDTEIEKESAESLVLFNAGEDTDPINICRYYSEYSRIIRVFAYILRFKNHARRANSLKEYRSLEISSEEYTNAETQLLKYVQCHCQLSGVPTDLQLFRDENGLIRVVTRILDKSDVECFQKPILLPNKHILVERLIECEHKIHMHASVLQIMVILRQRFWIIHARRIVKSVVAKCMSCKRQSAKLVQVPFAPLPVERTNGQRVFQHVGCDLMGPLFIDGHQKIWLILFTCATFRAVHFELARHISTEDLLLAVRRFCARRGRVETIFSDNGTNLVGADNLLEKIDWNKVEQVVSLKRIVWKRHPPTASWWGGFFERVVSMIKNILRKCLGRACLSYDEIHTVVCDVESVINSRPLTRLETEPTELSAITPNSFLHAAECSVADIDEADATHWNRRAVYVQSVRDALRQRFRNEYIALLVNRGKRRPRELEVGEIVLVEEEGKGRFHWLLGKIEEVHPGKDGYKRVATIRTPKGLIKRPYQRLAPLEVDNTCSSVGGSSEDFQERTLKQDVPDPQFGNDADFDNRSARDESQPDDEFELHENISEVQAGTDVDLGNLSVGGAELRSRGGRIIKKPTRLNL